MVGGEAVPRRVGATLARLARLDRLAGDGLIWPGWRPLAQPALISLAGGGGILLGSGPAPAGFAAVPLGDRGAVVHWRPESIRVEALRPGPLAGQCRVAHVGGELVPVVTMGTGRDPLVAVAALAGELFQAQVARALVTGLAVLAAAGEDEAELVEIREAASLPPDSPERLAGTMAELQRAYERYPETELLNNVLGNLEGRLLYGLEASDEFGAAAAGLTESPPELATARAVALVRRERHAALAPALVAYERRLEVYAGLPRYVELLVLRRTVAADDPAETGGGDAGIAGDADGATVSTRARLLETSRLGELARLNLKGWGAARRRFGHSGMGLALLLDRLGIQWRGELVAEGTPLDRLLESAVAFDGGDGDEQLLEAARVAYGYYERLEDERAWVREQQLRRTELVNNVLAAPGTRIAVDVSALNEKSSWCDAEGIERIGESVLVHSRPGVFTFGDGSTFVEFRGVSLAEDRRARWLHLTVPGRKLAIYGDEEPVQPTRGVEFTDGLSLDLGCLRVRAQRGTVERDGGALLIRLRG